jgi:hypothetical protein
MAAKQGPNVLFCKPDTTKFLLSVMLITILGSSKCVPRAFVPETHITSCQCGPRDSRRLSHVAAREGPFLVL